MLATGRQQVWRTLLKCCWRTSIMPDETMSKYYYGPLKEPSPDKVRLNKSEYLPPPSPAEIRSREKHTLPCGTGKISGDRPAIFEISVDHYGNAGVRL